ncbi:MAG TPA: FAD-dependent oxidoreductase, partial [Alphaproteobacteria bacterium]|nr:FAD-dependent oxidoreductase [Alphaproteobacteria bacterium]
MTNAIATDAIVVIGAGIVGLSVACHLRREGHEVVLLDPSAALAGASFGNAGSLSPGTVVPMALPGTLRQAWGWLLSRNGPLSVQWRHLPEMGGWIRRFAQAGTALGAERAAAALAPLLAHSPVLYRELVGGEAAGRLIRRDGSLTVFRSESDWEGSRFGFELRARNGIAWQEIAGPDLADFDPMLCKGLYRGVIFPENGHCADPGALLRELLAQFRAAGGRFVQARATGFALSGRRLAAIRTEDRGQIAARKAVIAAGARAAALARSVGDRVLLEAERGYHVMLRGAVGQPRLPTMDSAKKFVVTPMAGGVRIAGVAEFVRPGTPPRWRHARNLLAQGRDLFPVLAESDAR